MSFLIDEVDDSFARIKGLTPGTFDHVVTDPPYDPHCQDNQVSGTAMKAWVDGKLKSKGVPKKKLDFPPLESYAFVADLVRLSKRWSLVCCTLEALGYIRATVPATYKRGGIWYKPNAQGQLTGDRPANAYEGVAVLHEGKCRWNAKGSFGAWFPPSDDIPCAWVGNGTRGEGGRWPRHANQKPLALLMTWISQFTDPGEWIFDPFCGSGRIGEAALLCGRHYVGWSWVENPEWTIVARERCEEAQKRFGEFANFDMTTCRFARPKDGGGVL